MSEILVRAVTVGAILDAWYGAGSDENRLYRCTTGGHRVRRQENEPANACRRQLKKAEADTLKERQDLERLRADLEKKGPLLKEEERRNLELDFQKRSVTLQRTMGDLQQEIQLREREMMQDILKDLEGVVSEIGKADKFTLILDRSQILFGDQAIDLTNKVIETFNRAKK